MMNEKEFSMMDAFIALNELNDDSVENMIKSTDVSSKKLHEGKGYPISGANQSLEAAKAFLNENDEIQLEVIDPDADTLEHVKDRIDYVGQMILRCNRCHANRFIDMAALIESPESDETYNLDDECPNCKTSGVGYEIIGQVGKYEQDVAEEESEKEPEGEEPEVEAADVAVENDESNPDELKFENDSLEVSSDDSTEDEEPAEDVVDEVTDTSEEESEEPDMMETSTSEDDDLLDLPDLGDEVDVDDELQADEDEEEKVKESLNESLNPMAEEAWMMNRVIQAMNNEDAYYGSWLYTWPDGETREMCEQDFGTKEDFEDLKNVFIKVYKRYHSDGLFEAPNDVLSYAHQMDRILDLAPIENLKAYKESVEVLANTTISEVLGSILDTDKVDRIEITNRCDDKKDQKVYDGDYNNLPLNLANASCTGFDVNNRTLACNIDQDESHGRRPLSDILGKFTDDKSDNIHLYDIASSEEIFKGTKSDAINKFGRCGFISIDTPAVIRMTICDPSIITQIIDSDKNDEDKLIEHIIAENDLSITRLDAPYSNEFWIRESIKEKEDLELIYEAYVKPLGSELMKEFKAVTGYYNALDEAFEAGYKAAKEDVIDEDLADLYRKTFDKPASIPTQQSWEDEMTDIDLELGYGDPSDKRKAKLTKRYDKLANKFAQQRDWEDRHEKSDDVSVDEPELAAISEAMFDETWLEAAIEAGEITQEDADKAANIKFDILGEDVILFIQGTPIELESIKSVTYGDDVESYDGTYEVTLTDDTTHILGWKDYDDTLYPITEAFIGRDQMISELKKLGKNYYFDKYTDAQIFRIWQKEQAKVKATQKADLVEPEQLTCEQCGTRFNDGGTCPTCDDGEEDINEGNPVSRDLPPSIDMMLQDMAQMYNEFDYGNIMDFKPSDESIKQLRSIYRKWRRAAELEDDDTLAALAKDITSILTSKAKEECLTESMDLTLSQMVSDSIHHLISDLGYDSADEEFPDDVLADVENNYDVDIPDDPEGYKFWAGAVFDEISRQLNNLEESISESIDDDEFDDWVDDEINSTADEASVIDSETLKQIVNDEMPRAIKECGKKLRDIVAYFMSILPETDLGEVDQKELKAIVIAYLENNVDAADVAEQFQSFKSRKDLAAAITECKNNNVPYIVRRSVKEGYRYDLLIEADNAGEEINSAKESIVEGDNLPAQVEEPAQELTSTEAEISRKIMRISQDIATAISDVYGIEANPELIVADILQDLRLINGDIDIRELEDTPMNNLTAQMYQSHEDFYAFMDELVSGLTGQQIRTTPQQKFAFALKMLDSDKFSSEAIRAGIEDTKFQRLAAAGHVPFIPAGATPLLGESADDIDVDTDKFDADMNEYFNESYEDTVIYTTTSGTIESDGTIVLEGVLQTEELSTDVTFRLTPDSVLNESLENSSDKKAMLESLTYDVTNNISEEVFKFKFSE